MQLYKTRQAQVVGHHQASKLTPQVTSHQKPLGLGRAKYPATLFGALFPRSHKLSLVLIFFHLIPFPETRTREASQDQSSHGQQARGLFRRARRRGRRLRPRRAGGAGPHLPLRLHRRRRRHGRRRAGGAWRGHADGDAGGGRAGAGAGGGGAGDGGVPRVGRPPEPGGDAGAASARAHLGLQGGALRGGAAAGLLPRLHPPPLPHRRPGYSGARPRRRDRTYAGPGDGGHLHLLPPLRGLRDDPGPADHGARVRADAHGPHRRRQHACRGQLLRRVHEPGQVLRAGVGHWRVDQPLGLLARPAGRRAPCRVRVRVAVLGQEGARASARWGLLAGPAERFYTFCAMYLCG